MNIKERTQQTSVRLTPDVMKQFKIAVLKRDTTIQSVLERAVMEFLKESEEIEKKSDA